MLKLLTSHILVREICCMTNLATEGRSGYILREVKLSKLSEDVVELDVTGAGKAEIPAESLALSLDDFGPRYLAPMVALYPDVIAHNRRKRKLKTMRAKMKCRGPIRLAA